MSRYDFNTEEQHKRRLERRRVRDRVWRAKTAAERQLFRETMVSPKIEMHITDWCYDELGNLSRKIYSR